MVFLVSLKRENWKPVAMSSPLPPPLPSVDLGIQHKGSPVSLSVSKQSSHNEANSNLLSSQKFKDELATKQARLSPNPDSQLSIDEKIWQRKAAEARTKQQAEHSSCLPDKLMNSSTLQRDKRPFAYSPDVNDPKNRGKLDLSQIKSANMRRRLLANMEGSEEGDTEPTQEHTKQEPQKIPIASEIVPITLLDTDVQQAQPVYYTQPKPVQRVRKGAPKFPTEPCEGVGKSDVQPSRAAPTIVHYTEPPKFYTMQEGEQAGARHECLTRMPDQHQSQQISHLEALDAEVAESLESLSLLATKLEADWVQTPNDYRYRGSAFDSCSKGTSVRTQMDNNCYSRSSLCQQTECLEPVPQAQSVSSFLPRNQDQDRVQRTQQTRTVTFQRQVPDFHETSLSGRPVENFSAVASSAANYFGASLPSSVSHPIRSFYGSPIDADDQGTRSWGVVNSRAALHGTFFGSQNGSSATQCNTKNRQDGAGMSATHPSQPTTSRHWQHTSREDQVRALRQMTEKLQEEVNRLYNHDVPVENHQMM